MATITTTDEKDSGLDVKVLPTTLIAFRRGDFSTRMPNDWIGVHGKIARPSPIPCCPPHISGGTSNGS